MATIMPENPLRFRLPFDAEIAENAEGYDEMVNLMEKLVLNSAATSHGQLSLGECQLLGIAFKKSVHTLRLHTTVGHKNWVTISDRVELTYVCRRILKLLNTILIPSAAPDSEEKVFYMKLKGDYHPYLAEIKGGDERREAVDEALRAYLTAEHIAEAKLAPTSPLRLGLALNFAVFHYKVRRLPLVACSTALEAMEAAAREMETLAAADMLSQDTTLVFELLKDNYVFLSCDMHEKDNSYYGSLGHLYIGF